MILNIENTTVKIDFEARTVEVSQVTPNMTETETLVQAVERVSQPTLNNWVPTDAEMVEMAQEMNPEPSLAEIQAQRLDDFEEYHGRKATLEEAKHLFKLSINPFGFLHQAPTTRKPRALETQPREVCRSTCCGTLGRRTRDGSCAGCRGMNHDERQVLLLVNSDLSGAVEGEE